MDVGAPTDGSTLPGHAKKKQERPRKPARRRPSTQSAQLGKQKRAESDVSDRASITPSRPRSSPPSHICYIKRRPLGQGTERMSPPCPRRGTQRAGRITTLATSSSEARRQQPGKDRSARQFFSLFLLIPSGPAFLPSLARAVPHVCTTPRRK